MELSNIPALQTLNLLNPPHASLFWPRSELEDAGVLLPRFLDIQLPEPAPIAFLSYDGESFEHEETGLASASLADLHDALDARGFVVRFDPSLADHVASYVNTGMVFVGEETDGVGETQNRMLKSRAQEEDIALNGYMRFLHAFRQWEETRSVSAAWSFLDRHPAFWAMSDDGGWNMVGGMAGVKTLYYERGGEDWAAVETGEVDPSDQTTRTPDPRLFISARTMEQAVKALAMQMLSIHGLTREDEGGGFYRKLGS